MSDLFIRGEMIHCTECGVTREIAYKGAPKYYQIGHDHIDALLELNVKYLGEEYEAEHLGYYVQVELICESCASQIENVCLLERDTKASQLFEFYNHIQKRCEDELIKPFVDSIESSKKVWKRLMNLHSIFIKSELKKRISKVLKELSIQMEGVISGISTESDEYLSKYLSVHKSDNQKLSMDVPVYQKYELWLPRKLNPVLNYAATIATPVFDEGKLDYYMRVNRESVIKKTEEKINDLSKTSIEAALHEVIDDLTKWREDIDGFMKDLNGTV